MGAALAIDQTSSRFPNQPGVNALNASREKFFETYAV
jgi:hypothetical protein